MLKKLFILPLILILAVAGFPLSWSHETVSARVEVEPVPVKKVIENHHRASRSRPPAPKSHRVTKRLTSGGVWARLRECESGSDGLYLANTGNGYYGAYQFTLESWRAVGGTGYPHKAPPFEQDFRAKKLKALQGWGAWPACSSKLGL